LVSCPPLAQAGVDHSMPSTLMPRALAMSTIRLARLVW
jgi:hypothetical protein